MCEWVKIGQTFGGLDIEQKGNKRRLVDKNGDVVVEYNFD